MAMHGGGRLIAIVVLALVVLASLWYVQAPPRTEGDYRERAALTAETLRSQLETTELWVRELERDRVTQQAAAVGVREAEADAVAAASEFGAWDPRGDTRFVRSRLMSLVSEATEALSEIRVAAEDGRWEALPRLARPLPRLSARFDSFARRVDR